MILSSEQMRVVEAGSPGGATFEWVDVPTRAAHNALHIASRRRDPATGRLLDGVEHNGMPRSAA